MGSAVCDRLSPDSPEDDPYWEEYATTPKAFVSLATGRRLWGSRFGQSTSYRVPAAAAPSLEAVQRRLLAQLADQKAALGFAFRPIKRMQLAASRGNTPFDVLFLMLSFFIIAAALLLVVLLFRLGFEQRARQAGLLLAVGWNRRRLRRLLMTESLAVAACGGLLGVLIGLGYAAADAGSTAEQVVVVGCDHHAVSWNSTIPPCSLLIGYAAGVLVSVLTILLECVVTRKIAARQMLGGNLATAELAYSAPASGRGGGNRARAAGPCCWPWRPSGCMARRRPARLWAQAARFWWHCCWSPGPSCAAAARALAPVTGSAPLLKLAVRSAARNPTRSTLTIGLIATASFLDCVDERVSTQAHRNRYGRVSACWANRRNRSSPI